MCTTPSFSCFIIGEGSLPIQCAEILIERGHTIYGVISADPAVQRWANEHHILHSHPRDNLLEFIGRQPFDYLFSIVNPLILPAEILILPRKAAINYHDAPLPAYAGSSATFWALIQREAVHGVTWHEMSAQVDAGNILKQLMVEIAPRETTLTLNTKCYEAAIQAFTELVDDLAGDRMTPIRQNLAVRSFFPRSKRPPLAAVISWQQPAEAIDTLARALDFGPYPNPKGLPKLALGSTFLIIAELDVLDTCSTAAPGTITRIDQKVIQVATTTTDIALQKLLTIDGQNLPLAEVVTTFELHRGDQLPALSRERAERLTALHAAISGHEEFWAERLAALQPIVLPFVERQPPGGSVETARMTMPIPDTIRSYLASSQEDFSSFLRTAFVAYLARIGNMDQFDLGFSSAALLRELDDLDCLFASMLPLRVEVMAGACYNDLAQALEAQVAVVQPHQTYARDITMRYPLLRALPERHRYPALPVGVVEVADLNEVLPPADLLLAIAKADATCVWIYNPAVLDPETVERMQRQFTILLQSLVTDPAQPLADVPLLDEAECKQILYDWNATAWAYPQGCIHDLIAAQAARTPDAVALIVEDECLSYDEVNRRANQLAQYLHRLDAGPDTRVGIYLPRSLDLVVALLGVLKAGGCYVPLDPAYPQERLAGIVKDAQLSVVITYESLQHGLANPEDTWLPVEHLVRLDTERAALSREPSTNPPTRITPDHLAYVIFTSGSTGRPKGVAVAHRQLLNYVFSIIRRLDLPQDASFATVSTFAADLGHTVIFPALCSGGSLHVIGEERVLEPDALAAYVHHHGIDCIKIVPSHLAALLTAAQPAHVLPRTLLVLGGEAAGWNLIAQVQALAPACRILNHYGPTETTVGVLTYPVTEEASRQRPGVLPLGRPLDNTQILLLDGSMQPVPIGVMGELYVGGVQLARGYLHRPDLTAERFVPHPFSQTPGQRLYRTGDLARYQPDGTIAFVGRADQQIKLRGYRIELGEIEAVLRQHPSLAEAVVLLREDEPGDKRLVAYVVEQKPGNTARSTKKREASADGGAWLSVLGSFLREQLPEYMVPSAFVVLDALPLTANGKIDHTALSKLAWVEPQRHTAVVVPRTLLEEALLGIWQETCRRSRISVDDNFFDLGGNSLTATQIVSRVKRAFKVNLTVRDIFAAPTVAALARHLQTHERQPGHMDRVAVVLMRLWNMSPEERQRVLQQKKAK